MATFYSKQRLDQLANPRIKAKPNELAGRVRAAHFSYTAPAAGQTPQPGDVIELTMLPAGSRFLQAHMTFNPVVAGATVSLGVPGAPGKYGASVSLGSTPGFTPNHFAQINGLEEMTAVPFILTLSGAGLPNGFTMRGYVLYAVD